MVNVRSVMILSWCAGFMLAVALVNFYTGNPVAGVFLAAFAVFDAVSAFAHKDALEEALGDVSRSSPSCPRAEKEHQFHNAGDD